MARLFSMIRHAWVPTADPTESFEGRNVIVTGANTGLGFEAATKFAALGASKVILGVRDLKKGDTAKSLIEERTGKKDRVEVWQLDMNSYESIQDFGKRASDLDHLDVAILNAGVYMVKYEKSPYGWEETLQVNLLSTAFLGILLLPKLKTSQSSTGHQPVLEIVSSGTHSRAEVSASRRASPNLLATYNDPANFQPGQQYGSSKLLVMYVMQTLASFARPSSDVIVTSVCPGACKSDLARGYNGYVSQLLKFLLFSLFLRTTEQGARTLVSGATLGKEGHAGFWQHDEIQTPVPLVSGAEGEQLRKRVWSEVIDALKKDVPSVVDAVATLENRTP